MMRVPAVGTEDAGPSVPDSAEPTEAPRPGEPVDKLVAWLLRELRDLQAQGITKTAKRPRASVELAP